MEKLWIDVMLGQAVVTVVSELPERIFELWDSPLIDPSLWSLVVLG